MVLLDRVLTFLIFLQIRDVFPSPIRSKFSTGNHNHAIALFALSQTLAAQIVVVLPAGLGIDKQRPFPLISF